MSQSESEEEEIEEMCDNQPMCVAPGLYLGGVDAALNSSALSLHSITKSLCCCCEADLEAVGCSNAPADLKLDWLDVPTQQIEPLLYEALDALKQHGSDSWFVYCVAGRSRSVVVVVSWLMLRQGCSFNAAIAAVELVRPWVAPNCGFVEQLQAIDQTFKLEALNMSTAPEPVALAGTTLRYLPRIDFAPQFVTDIRNSSKLATTRVRGHKDTDHASELDALQVGKLCVAVVEGTRGFQVLRITMIENRLFNEVDDELARIETFDHGFELQDILKRFYPGVGDDDPIQVIHFQLFEK